MIRSLVRTLSFFSNWVGELVRQPALLASLVLGPFLILLAFGLGVRTYEPAPRIALVHPASGLSPDMESVLAGVRERSEIVAETSDLDQARSTLVRGGADLVIVVPDDPMATIEQGRHAELRVLTNEIDPIRTAFALAYLNDQTASLNRQVIAESIERVQARAQEAQTAIADARRYVEIVRAAQQAVGADVRQAELAQQRLDEARTVVTRMQQVPPEVASEPFTLDVENVAPFLPTTVGFYAPAVLVLLLQHLAITLGALSMTRIRLLGIINLLRVAPVRPAEVIVGHYLSYTMLCVVVGAVLTALLMFGLGMPLFGSYQVFVGLLLALVLSGLGFGFLIAMVSSTERQAAQLVMLLLLASIFFSGLLFSLERIILPFRAVSFALPATYAIRSLQDVMLRGVLRSPQDVAFLVGAGVVLFVLAVVLLRREYRPA